MKTSNYLILTFLISCISFSQNQIKPLEGYNKLVSAKFSIGESELLLDSLVIISLSKSNGHNQLIPLSFISHGDTITKVYYLKDLRSLKKKIVNELRFVNEFTQIDVNGYDVKRSLIKEYDKDSIANINEQNMMVNSELFDWDQYFELSPSSACCSFDSHQEKIAFVYWAFINGILLEEDDPSGGLHYIPY